MKCCYRQAHVRAAVTYGQEWQFVIYHAPQIGRRDCIQTLCHSQSGVKPDDVDLILGLLLDMVRRFALLIVYSELSTLRFFGNYCRLRTLIRKSRNISR